MKYTDHLQNQSDYIETLICDQLSEKGKSALRQAIVSIEYHLRMIQKKEEKSCTPE